MLKFEKNSVAKRLKELITRSHTATSTSPDTRHNAARLLYVLHVIFVHFTFVYIAGMSTTETPSSTCLIYLFTTFRVSGSVNLFRKFNGRHFYSGIQTAVRRSETCPLNLILYGPSIILQYICNATPPSKCRGQERVELYLHPPYGPS